MRKLLLAVAVTLGFAMLAHAVCDPRTTTCLTSLDVANTVTVSGLTNSGDSAITGNQTVTGTLGVTGVTTLSAALVPWPRTIAQLGALIPGTTGQLVVCSDCIRSAICLSSGSVKAGSWVIATATGTMAGTTFSGFPHCQ